MQGNEEAAPFSAAETTLIRAIRPAMAAMMRAFEEDLRPQGLSHTEYIILIYLSEAPGRSMRLGDLADNVPAIRLCHRTHRTPARSRRPGPAPAGPPGRPLLQRRPDRCRARPPGTSPARAQRQRPPPPVQLPRRHRPRPARKGIPAHGRPGLTQHAPGRPRPGLSAEARPACRSFCACRTVMRYQGPDSAFQISSSPGCPLGSFPVTRTGSTGSRRRHQNGAI